MIAQKAQGDGGGVGHVHLYLNKPVSIGPSLCPFRCMCRYDSVPVTHRAAAISGSRGTCTGTGIYKAGTCLGEGRNVVQCFVVAQRRRYQPFLSLQQGCLKNPAK